jgi:CDP-glycerol glycerophosphotransferase (TagB/SpsB family)
MYVMFDVVNVYYIPQYRPIFEKLISLGHDVKLVCYKCNIDEKFEVFFYGLNVDFQWVANEKEASEYYVSQSSDWIFFGNSFKHLSVLPVCTKTVQLGHGIGPKPSYYHKSNTPMTVRFIEGEARLFRIRELYPDDEFVQLGYSKLDPIFNGEEKGLDLSDLGLDPKLETILYAPTFNPSSLECFPDDWPKDFAEYNILIKPHTFTYTIEQYEGQRKKLKKWAKFDNVHLASQEDLSLVPFIAIADILLSEASSTLFEFVAINKPVVVCDFFKLKWSYRGIFNYRFKKRFEIDNVLYKDIGKHVTSYKQLVSAVSEQLAYPEQYQEQRAKYTKDHVGPVDGMVSQRIVDYLLANN